VCSATAAGHLKDRLNKELKVLRRQPDGRWKIARLMINSNGYHQIRRTTSGETVTLMER
jgi:ketosteroid isomerase-like protein